MGITYTVRTRARMARVQTSRDTSTLGIFIESFIFTDINGYTQFMRRSLNVYKYIYIYINFFDYILYLIYTANLYLSRSPYFYFFQ